MDVHKQRMHKVVMLGDSGVGKTSMVAKLCNPDKPMNTNIPATMGIEFDTRVLNTPSGKVKAQLWDTAGQERFARVLLPTYFRKAKGVILVYDVTSLRSFESLGERWMIQMKDHMRKEQLCMLLVGNKSDLDDKEVSTEVAETFAAAHGMQLIETSARTGENIKLAFEQLVTQVHEKSLREKGPEEPQQTIKLDARSKGNEESSGCC
ncbi:hypothetical protein ScalyP_jg3590 [Parmales sp. scaly parma]|nr:hypothetical protein ScalyP_jg3590 [Parmales sp. scaly parma]